LNDSGTLAGYPKSNNGGKASHILRPSSAMGVPHLPANFTGKDTLWPVLFTVIENQIVQTSRESYMTFVENRCPLHRGAM